MDGIIAVISLRKEKAGALFQLFTDDQGKVYEFNKAEFNFSSNRFVQFMSKVLYNKPPMNSIVQTIDEFDQLDSFDATKKEQVKQDLFYVTGKGQSYELKVVLIKLFTGLGSRKSVFFLNKLS